MANLTNNNKLIELLNWLKVRINEVEEAIPVDVSQLNNDAWYITKAVNDLVNYYDKQEVDDLLAWIVWLEIVKVDELPSEWENGKIYLVPSESEADTYDEYIWVSQDSTFEKIWNLHADFSNFYTKEEVDEKLDEKADKTDTYTKTEADALLDDKANVVDVYNKIETYSKTETDTLLANKVDKSSVLEKVFEISTTTYSNLTEEDVDTLKEVWGRYKSWKTPAIKCWNIIYRYHHNYDRETHEDSIAFVRDYVDGNWSDKIEEFYIVYLDLSNPSQWIDGVGIRELWTTFNPSNTWTNKQVLTKTSTWYKWDNVEWWDVKYEDFGFVAMTWTVIENLSSTKSISADTTLTAGATLKEWMQYLVVVSNTDTAKHTVTFWSESVDVEAGESKKLVFLATSNSTLELQTCEWGWGWWVTPGNGTITVTQWGVEKWTFTVNQSTDTTIELDAVSEDIMEYPDFNFVDKDWTAITLDLNSTITPTNNFTVNVPAEIKDWQIYILRVDSWSTEFTMTLGTDITNPYNIDLSLWTNTLSQFVFLAVDDTLELQPQLMTRVDVENILREYNLIP